MKTRRGRNMPTRSANRQPNAESSSTCPPVSEAGWQYVIDHGTKFFGQLDLCPYWEARLAAWGWIQSASDKAAEGGADADFLAACALYIAELAEAWDKNHYKDVWHDTKQRTDTSQKTTLRLSKAGSALSKIKTISHQIKTAPAGSIKTIRQRWDGAKWEISQEEQSSEAPVDRAFEACEANPTKSARGSVAKAINQFLRMEPLAPQSLAGKPTPPALVRALRGMDIHLAKTMGSPQRRRLLSELLGFPNKQKLCGFSTSPHTLALLIRQRRIGRKGKRIQSRRSGPTTDRVILTQFEREWTALHREIVAHSWNMSRL
jgi:hypothetical protein